MAIKQIFTFGKGQKHKGKFVVITGKNKEDCRDQMIQAFGMEWAYQYNDYRLQQMKDRGMKELKIK